MKNWITVKRHKTQGVSPMWSIMEPSGLFHTGRYTESEEFKICTYSYKVWYIWGKSIWTGKHELVSESEWFTCDTYVKKMGYGI